MQRQVPHFERIAGLKASSRAIWSTSSVCGSRCVALGAGTSIAGLCGSDRLAHQEVEERADRRHPALDAAALETRARGCARQAAHVLVIERPPAVDAVLVAPRSRRRQVVRVAVTVCADRRRSVAR